MSGNGGAKFGGSFGGSYGGSFGGMPAQPAAAPEPAAPAAAAGELIKDTTTRDLREADVIEESKQAVPCSSTSGQPWCGPCKTAHPDASRRSVRSPPRAP
jgi:putative thioredoxin